MKKTIITTAITAALGLSSFGANALTSNSVLSFTAGGHLDVATGCTSPLFTWTGSTCTYGGTEYTTSIAFTTELTGSYFGMDTNGSAQGTPPTPDDPNTPEDEFQDNAIEGSDGFEGEVTATGVDEFTPISPTSLRDIVLGAGSTPTSPEYVDATWSFFSNPGNHYVAGGGLSAPTSNTLDMTGWTVHWGADRTLAESHIDMGSGVSPFDPRAAGNGGILDATNIATLTCSDGTTCGNGATFSMDYYAVVPAGGFTGVLYKLHLEGTIEAVPVPAAVWLFGSGLLGLVGVARRKAHA